MQDNYEPWEVNYKEFYTLIRNEDKLKFLLRFAVLAPSSHNSQPWRFRVNGDKIIILSEISRALPESDRDSRQLFISLGAAVGNILIAAGFYGYKAEVKYLPTNIPNAAVSISLLETKDKVIPDEKIINSIISRHTNRNKYSDKKLPEQFLNQIKALSNDKFDVRIVEDRRLKDTIADIVSSALIEAMDDPGFRHELSGYVKSNITKAKIGMPMFGFGMPTPISLIAPYLLGRFNLNRLSKSQDDALLKKHTPYFVIISSATDDRESWIKSGQIFESIVLMAEKENIKTAPMAAIIQIGDSYKKLQRAINTNLRPQVFFRIGYSDIVTPHSPRLKVEDVLDK